ncbi:MarR family winged helix-turn-helix transcriptional regulator [Lentilactobacillus farraginis]|uniref:MarR family transcriptional regulator n=1 Tax=Lentilactobacillus farraginis DSM 18382 = JCM 14108 TaxID=1423743 RepID=X0PAW6_9LACO|nr:MarR family transcriptional regulator [Lentilactobacillus farraginis]KRM06365.1 MarR family transcriptional regulator [Lentilactobacillus farraginis DSM 18382 = JCM 14108]GAF36899.1 transcriptional regulator, MarR family [Lentilactobacillus farraginis DSM 18382 = JCM 14108]
MAEILRPIGVIARALDAIANVEFKRFDLSKGQYLYLIRIYEHPGIIQERLAEMIKVDRTTAARAIQKLEKSGLIEKRPDDNNKKIRRLFVSERGRQLAPVIERENHYSNKMALTGLSNQQADQLAELLEKVSQNVSDDWERVKKGHQRLY